ncbi:MAG: rubrerythrin-like domain-containing protein [Halobacteriales archaeon]
MHPDPESPEESYYECRGCELRIAGEDVAACPECGDQVRNISVPRE